MRSLDDVISGNEPAEVIVDQPAQDVAPVEPQEAQEPAGDTPAEKPADGAPPAPDDDDEEKALPMHVVKAMRKEKNDWKEKALTAQARLDERERLEKQQREMSLQQQPQGQQPQMSPEEQFEQRMFIERSNMSQMVAKRDYPDLDEKVEFFVENARNNPALIAEMKAHPHPFEFAYKKAVQLQTLAEIGDDPVAYRERMKEQLRSELAAPQPADPAPAAAPRAPLPPASLATARSAAPRNAPAWTGSRPLEDILRK